MTAALAFQLASLLVSVAMVPILLGFLGTGDYLVWAVFTTIGGLTLQIEGSIQTLMVRRVAPALAAQDQVSADHELGQALRAYRLLSLSVVVIVMPLGLFYLGSVVPPSTVFAAWQGWPAAWLCFIAAYAINYLFGPNNVLLLSTAQTDRLYWYGTVTRLLNFAGAVAGLWLGFGLIAIAASFLVSVIANVVMIGLAARRTLGRSSASVPPLTAARRFSDEAGMLRYGTFTFSSYLLYRGAFLVAVSAFPVQAAASYGLALQAFAILGVVATIPLQIRLQRLIAAMKSSDHAGETREIGIALAFATLVMVMGATGLAIVGPWLLWIIGSSVTLPDHWTIALMATAFLVEAVILVLTNYLLLARRLQFIPRYVAVVAFALASASAALANGASLAVAMLVIPLTAQLLMSLPLVIGCLADARGGSLAAWLKDLSTTARRALGAVRR